MLSIFSFIVFLLLSFLDNTFNDKMAERDDKEFLYNFEKDK